MSESAVAVVPELYGFVEQGEGRESVFSLCFHSLRSSSSSFFFLFSLFLSSLPAFLLPPPVQWYNLPSFHSPPPCFKGGFPPPFLSFSPTPSSPSCLPCGCVSFHSLPPPDFTQTCSKSFTFTFAAGKREKGEGEGLTLRKWKGGGGERNALSFLSLVAIWELRNPRRGTFFSPFGRQLSPYLPTESTMQQGGRHKNSEQTKNRRGPEWNFLIFSLHFYLPNNAGQ